ncbi:hypothetical protein BC829DRAFT_415205 [Chytridium lagenaria]|nr:hypothetical protein BC829DRAFT_415205 [Chytridium lagenaria]
MSSKPSALDALLRTCSEPAIEVDRAIGIPAYEEYFEFWQMVFQNLNRPNVKDGVNLTFGLSELWKTQIPRTLSTHQTKLGILQQKSPGDHAILINLVNFAESFFVKVAPDEFSRWIGPLGEKCIGFSEKFPLVKQDIFVDRSQILRQISLFSAFAEEVMLRMEQFKDDLFMPQGNPSSITCSETIASGADAGLSYTPLATLALDAIEEWMEVYDLHDIALVIKEILPCFMDYLTSYTESTENSVISSSASRFKPKYRRKKKAYTQSEEPTQVGLPEVFIRIGAIIGRLGSFKSYLVLDGKPADLSAWSPSKKVLFKMPFQDFFVELYFDRRTKVAACEFLHSVILLMIGGSQSVSETGAQVLTRELFRPLTFQIIHWLTKNSRYENPETMVLLECCFDILTSDASNLREFGSDCITEFFRWSLKHTSDKHASKEDDLLGVAAKSESAIKHIVKIIALRSLNFQNETSRRRGFPGLSVKTLDGVMVWLLNEIGDGRDATGRQFINEKCKLNLEAVVRKVERVDLNRPKNESELYDDNSEDWMRGLDTMLDYLIMVSRESKVLTKILFFASKVESTTSTRSGRSFSDNLIGSMEKQLFLKSISLFALLSCSKNSSQKTFLSHLERFFPLLGAVLFQPSSLRYNIDMGSERHDLKAALVKFFKTVKENLPFDGLNIIWAAFGERLSSTFTAYSHALSKDIYLLREILFGLDTIASSGVLDDVLRRSRVSDLRQIQKEIEPSFSSSTGDNFALTALLSEAIEFLLSNSDFGSDLLFSFLDISSENFEKSCAVAQKYSMAAVRYQDLSRKEFLIISPFLKTTQTTSSERDNALTTWRAVASLNSTSIVTALALNDTSKTAIVSSLTSAVRSGTNLRSISDYVTFLPFLLLE